MDQAAADYLRLPTITMRQQTNVFDANPQKELLSEFEQDSKIKPQEYSKFLAGKKTLITIIFRQCNETTKNKLFSKRIKLRTTKQEDSSSSSSDYTQLVLVATSVAYHNRYTSKL